MYTATATLLEKDNCKNSRYIFQGGFALIVYSVGTEFKGRIETKLYAHFYQLKGLVVSVQPKIDRLFPAESYLYWGQHIQEGVHTSQSRISYFLFAIAIAQFCANET